MRRRMYPLSCLLLLALPVCLDQIIQGEDQFTRDAALAINKAERQIELGLLKKAAELLHFYLQRLPADPPLSSGYHRLTRLLAKASFQSNDYEEALLWADKCRKHLDRFAKQNGELAAERQHVAVLLAKIHEARKQPTEATRLLEGALQLIETHPGGDPVWQIEVLAHLARVHFVARDDDQLAPIRQQVKQAVLTLKSKYRQRLISLDTYYQAVRAFANYLANTGKRVEAITQWIEVLMIFSQSAGHHQTVRQAEIWSGIARVHGQLGNRIDQLEALNRALHRWTKATNVSMVSAVGRVEHQVRIAAIHHRIALVIDEINRDPHATENLADDMERRADVVRQIQSSLVAESRGRVQLADRESGTSDFDLDGLRLAYLRVCEHLYANAIRELRAIDSIPFISEAESDRAIALEITALQGLLIASSNLLSYSLETTSAEPSPSPSLSQRERESTDAIISKPFSSAGPFLHLKSRADDKVAAIDNVVEATRLLHDRLAETRLAIDPRIDETKAVLDHLLLQRLILLAEAKRHGGSIVEARMVLEKAVEMADEQRSRREPAEGINQLEAAVYLALGRVLAELGEYDYAASRFDRVEHKAHGSGDHEYELAALRSKGAMNMMRLCFDDASNAFDQSIERHNTLIASQRQATREEQTELLTDHVRLMESLVALQAALPADKQNLTQIENTLDKTVKLHKRLLLSEDNPLTRQVWHQRAVLRILRNRAEPNKGERDAARQLWQRVLRQQPDDSPVEKARTLHYLARLRFLDWSDQSDRSKRRNQQLYLAQSAPYEERLKRFQKRRQTFFYECEKYNIAVGAKSKEYEYLKQWKSNLEIEKRALNKLIPGLQLQYDGIVSALAGRTRLLANLDQMLLEAEQLARDAAGILKPLKREWSLHYLVLCNYAQILRARDTRDKKEEAVCQLEQAISLIQDPPRPEFGRDVDPRSFRKSYAHLARGPLKELREALGQSDQLTRQPNTKP